RSLFVFFFSSRRRHTRSDRDWSSDVCSSDLAASLPNDIAVHSDLKARQPHFPAKAKAVIQLVQNGGPSQMDLFDPKPALTRLARSEERRVGKSGDRGGRRNSTKKD